MPGVSGVSAVSVLPFGGGGACEFELLARFNAADQGYANAQILDTIAEGVEIGRLTIVELDGVAELLSNEFTLGTKTVSDWSDLGFYSTDSVVKALGKAMLWMMEVTNVNSYLAVGLNDAPSVNAPTFWEYSLYAATATLRVTCDAAPVASVDCGALTADAEHECAIVMGGYDVNQQPWYEGAVGTFTYGASVFIRGGAYTDWTLLFRVEYGGSNVRPASVLRSTGGRLYVDNVRVPTFDYSAALQPVNADWFTGPNGQSLDVHVPDVGGMWNEDVGDWDIQGNRANTVAPQPASPRYVATVETGLADAHVRVTAQCQAGDWAGLVFRYTDSQNFWVTYFLEGLNEFRIGEVNAGVGTTRASVGVAIAPATDYSISNIADGQDMQAFLDYANKLTWTSAFNQNATRAGMRGGHVGALFNNFHVNRVRGSQYNVLNNCP
jgi:hypothetical protein